MGKKNNKGFSLWDETLLLEKVSATTGKIVAAATDELTEEQLSKIKLVYFPKDAACDIKPATVPEDKKFCAVRISTIVAVDLELEVTDENK